MVGTAPDGAGADSGISADDAGPEKGEKAVTRVGGREPESGVLVVWQRCHAAGLRFSILESHFDPLECCTRGEIFRLQ